MLERALEASSGGRPRELVELVREAWRETREPTLARIYERLVRELRGPALAGRDGGERAASWRERAQRSPGDPLELPILVDEPWDPALDEGERLTLLEAWSPDPLLASALARRLRIPLVPPAQPGSAGLVGQTIALLAAQRDPRQLPTIEWLAAEPFLSAKQRAQVRRAHEALAAAPIVRLGPEDRRALTRLERRAQAQADLEARSAELLAAVYADPDRDEPRLVFADWLSSRGDPWGEFIILQVGRARSRSPVSARESELLTRHAAQWSGALRGVLGADSWAFERGFLSGASVEVANLDGPVVDAGEWSTLRVLDGHVSDALARRGPLDQLRELYGYLQLERFVALRADNRLAGVETYECSLADPNLPLDTPLGLRALLVRRALDHALIELARSVAITGLEQLGVYYDADSQPRSGADHRERIQVRHRHELLCARLPIHVRRLQLLDGSTARASRPSEWLLTFARDELDVFARLRVDWRAAAHGRRGHDALEHLLEILDSLGLASLRRLELGRFDDRERALAVVRLRELADASGYEFVDAP